MAKLSNLIFYNEKWGNSNVIQREKDVSFIPDVGETVVLGSYNFYKVLERVMDYSDNIVHIRLEKSNKCLDLSI